MRKLLSLIITAMLFTTTCFASDQGNVNYNSAEQWEAKGIAAINQGDDINAESYFTQAITLSRAKKASPFFNRGLSRMNANKLEDALRDFNQAIAIESNATFFNGRGLCLERLGRNNEALSDFNRALAIDPQMSVAYANRGNTYADLGNIDQAIKDWTTAIMFNPNDELSYFNRGQVYATQGKYGPALGDFSEVIKLVNSDTAYYMRALCYEELGRLQEALNDYNAALQINPNLIEAKDNRELLLERMRQKK